MPRSEWASGSVRQVRIECLRPCDPTCGEGNPAFSTFLIHRSPRSEPRYERPQPGGGDAQLALPPGSVAQNPATALRYVEEMSRQPAPLLLCRRSERQPSRTVPINVKLTLARHRVGSSTMIACR